MAADVSYELTRVRLNDGWETTVYLVRHPLATTSARVVWFSEAQRLDHWCVDHGHPEAIVAGFFLRDPWRPLGEVRIDGAVVEHDPVTPPWSPKRGCVQIDGGIRIARREELADDPPRDLVQAGPLLVSDGRSLIDGQDREGFSAGAGQFDSDITDGRHPRCALGLNDTELLAVCCDGRRSGVDGGLSLGELARLMLLRRRRGDQPRRRWLRDPRPPKAPAQPPLLGAGSARSRVSSRRHRAALRAQASGPRSIKTYSGENRSTPFPSGSRTRA